MRPGTASLLLCHLVGNALLLLLGYYWLGLGEANALQLVWSTVVILLLLTLTLWLQGTAFAFFRTSEGLTPSALRVLRHLPALLALAMIALLCYGLLAWCQSHITRQGFLIASYLTLTFRHPVKPLTMVRILGALLWTLHWVVLPVIFLPLMSDVAVDGFSTRPFRINRKWTYWIEVGPLLICGLWVPFKLLGWIPEWKNFNLQLLSFAARASSGYLLFIASSLTLAFLTSSGKPRVSQEKTVDSP